MKCILKLIILLLLFSACKDAKKLELSNREQVNSEFHIEIMDDEAKFLLDANTPIEIIAKGFEWVEGPLWIENGKYLLFSDVKRNKIYKLDANGDTITYLFPSGYMGKDFKGPEPGSNGLLLNPEDELVMMQHGERKVVKMNASLNAPKTDFITLVEGFNGKKLNSPNDGTFDKLGNLYFTDPPYGLPLKDNDPEKELSFQGVYCLLKTGELKLLDSLTKPNGIALSPDESTLYVAVSDKEHAVWYSYDVLSEGAVSNKKLFYDVTYLVGKEGQQGLPDGMKVNRDGYIFASGPGGIWIFNPKAIPIARIFTGKQTSNCTFSKDQKK
ncbi:MAG: gluconolactonase, partial [Flavobacteriales bacterium 32-35-8]